MLPASGLIRKVGGMIAYQEARDIVEFMRTGINRQRKRTAIIIKRGPKSYEFIYGRTYGRGGCSSTLSGYATETAVFPTQCFSNRAVMNN